MHYLETPFKAMGSLCQLKLYLPSNLNHIEVSRALIETVRHYENKYTRFKSTSLTSQINQAAGTGQRIKVDEETTKLLDYAHVLFTQSEGLFDITSGVLRNAWDFRKNIRPSDAQIHRVLPLIGWSAVEWKASSIYLPMKGMQIDFGGFVKEYIADVIANQCLSLGISYGLVNLGGDIKVIGPHPDGSAWQVGIQHPRIAGESIASIALSCGGIASSGDYERFMEVDGQRYCHLLNPKTGQSIQPYFSGVSVVANDCLIAGSFTTLALLKSEKEPEWIQDSGLPFLAIDQAMNVIGTLKK